MITTIASHEILVLRRQRTFMVFLLTLLAMTVLAGVLGWSSQHTIARVYDEAVALLAATGQPAPPNPFLLKPPLSLLSNMVVYIPLIGALFALLLGHLAIVDDETDGIGRLLFSRRLVRTDYVIGKIAGAAAAIAVVLAASMVISIAALLVVNHRVSLGQVALVGLFYAVSWLYLMVFALVGMIAVLVTRRRSLSLLVAMGIWLVVTFAVPQVTSGLRPAQSLNPITDPVSTSQAFFAVTSHLRPYSIVEQYKETSARLLQTAAVEPAWQSVERVLPLLVLLAVLVLLAIRLVRGHDFSRSVGND